MHSMTSTTDDTSTCPTWCAGHARGGAEHRSRPLPFEVRHAETESGEVVSVRVSGWSDVADDRLDPARVVLDLAVPAGIAVDCFGEAWLTAADARVLADNLLEAAHLLDGEGRTNSVCGCDRG